MKSIYKSLIKLMTLSFLAGIMIAFGALCNLVALYYSEKFLGSLLFSFGLFFVFLFELKLFTGMVAKALEMKFKDWYQLFICFIVSMFSSLTDPP